MSLLLAGLVLAGTSGALLVGRWLARARGEIGAERGEGEASGGPEDAASARPGQRASGAARRHLDGFPCQLGDVVMRITGEEAWLAGGLVLSEGVPVAALFVAPEAGHDVAVYARARSPRTLAWLEPLDPGAVLVGGEPPSAVEHGGVRFDRVRRLPLRSERIGAGAPDVGDVVMVADYESPGAERLLVLKGNAGVVRAYRGIELAEGAFEVIASGEGTLG